MKIPEPQSGQEMGCLHDGTVDTELQRWMPSTLGESYNKTPLPADECAWGKWWEKGKKSFLSSLPFCVEDCATNAPKLHFVTKHVRSTINWGW